MRCAMHENYLLLINPSHTNVALCLKSHEKYYFKDDWKEYTCPWDCLSVSSSLFFFFFLS